LGDAAAMNNNGLSILRGPAEGEGVEVEVDKAEAKRRYEKAAGMGEAEAMRDLERMKQGEFEASRGMLVAVVYRALFCSGGVPNPVDCMYGRSVAGRGMNGALATCLAVIWRSDRE
jgi:TPR repeat protein